MILFTTLQTLYFNEDIPVLCLNQGMHSLYHNHVALKLDNVMKLKAMIQGWSR